MKQQFSSDEILNFKRLAAEREVDFVKSGMVLGLGCGTTVNIMIESLGQRIAAGKLSYIAAVPASNIIVGGKEGVSYLERQNTSGNWP